MSTIKDRDSLQLPIYLQNEIIVILINQLLIYDNRIDNKSISNKNYYGNYSCDRFLTYWDEILNLSIISKRWFYKISDLISSKLNENENNILKTWVKFNKERDQLICFRYGRINKFKINNGDWSIVKIDNKIIDNFYDNEFIVTTGWNKNLSKFKKVEFKLNLCGVFLNIFKSKLPDHVELVLYYQCGNNYSIFDSSRHSTPHSLNIKSFMILETDNSYIDAIRLLQFPKVLDFSRETGPKNSISYLPLFKQYTLNNRVLESVKIKYPDMVEPISVSLIKNELNLKTLSVGLSFHEIIRNNEPNLSDVDCKGAIMYDDELQECLKYELSKDSKKPMEEFKEMIETLSTNKTIYNLSLFNFCKIGSNCLNNGYIANVKIVSNSFKSLFETNKTIHALKLKDFDFLDSNAYSGLINNSTIKYLILNCISLNESDNIDSYLNNVQYLLSTVFTCTNSGIRHFKFVSNNYKIANSILSTLLQYPINNLLSIQLSFDIDNNLPQLIKLLNSSEPTSTCSIKEFNLKIIKKPNLIPNYHNIKNQILNHPGYKNYNNKKIINII